jgi:hypothetical protein
MKVKPISQCSGNQILESTMIVSQSEENKEVVLGRDGKMLNGKIFFAI